MEKKSFALPKASIREDGGGRLAVQIEGIELPAVSKIEFDPIVAGQPVLAQITLICRVSFEAAPAPQPSEPRGGLLPAAWKGSGGYYISPEDPESPVMRDCSFDEAFANARFLGADTFHWKGARYHTGRADDLKGETK